MTTLTRHGTHRIRERIGLPKKAVQKLADRAFEQGACPRDFSGSIRRYLDKQSIIGRSSMRVFNGYVFVFADDRLVSAWPLPAKYRRAKPAASVDTRPEGGDATEIAAPFTGGAVPDRADAQKEGPPHGE